MHGRRLRAGRRPRLRALLRSLPRAQGVSLPPCRRPSIAGGLRLRCAPRKAADPRSGGSPPGPRVADSPLKQRRGGQVVRGIMRNNGTGAGAFPIAPAHVLGFANESDMEAYAFSHPREVARRPAPSCVASDTHGSRTVVARCVFLC